MERSKISEWIDIDVPRHQVFNLVTNLERRMQLSPLWGVSKITGQSEEYPKVGGGYFVSMAEGEQPEYETVVTANDPPLRFAYCLDIDMDTNVTWTIQETVRGSRLTYTEDFLSPNEDREAFEQQVRKTIAQWLQNIKRYLELRPTGYQRLIRFALDKYYLRLGPEQRRIVAMLLFMQITGTLAFIMAALGMGIVGLIIK